MYKRQIMNRWGEELFYTANKDLGWDGIFKGHEVEAGVYTYRIDFINIQEEKKQYLGHVTLVR